MFIQIQIITQHGANSTHQTYNHTDHEKSSLLNAFSPENLSHATHSRKTATGLAQSEVINIQHVLIDGQPSLLADTHSSESR